MVHRGDVIRHSPCEKYIEYLIVHPDGWSDDAIIELLRLKQLDFIGPKYISRLRSNLHPPDPFVPDNRFHKPSVRFITAKKLLYAFHPDDAMTSALRILDEPRAKELVETMLISNDAAGLIVLRLRNVGIHVEMDAIHRYRFFFFNLDLVDATELNALLRLRTDMQMTDSDEYDDQVRAAMKAAGHKDPRRLAARYPITDIARAMSTVRMGYMPNRLEFTRLLQTGQLTAVARSIEATVDSHRAADARDWALTAKMFQEMLMEVGAPDAEFRKELQHMALATDGTNVPYIAELSGGNHTVDLQPLEAEGVNHDE